MGSGSGASLKSPDRRRTSCLASGAGGHVRDLGCPAHQRGRASRLPTFGRGVLRPKGQARWVLGHVFRTWNMRAIKPIGQLVLVSSTRHRAYTPSLSTWSSSTALIGSTRFEVGFPLRCLQRLSRPYIATLHCGWRHNSSTRGTSIPVLSY